MARLIGDNRDETLTGTSSADLIDGQGGDDTINAGGGNDTIVIGGGFDKIDGGDGIDRIRFDQTTYFESTEPNPPPPWLPFLAPAPTGLAWDHGLFIDLVTGETSVLGGDDFTGRVRFGTIRVTNVEEYEMTSHDDQFYGSSNGERVLAGAGDDILDGRGGDDRLLAGSGADYMDGRFGADVIDGGDLAANFYDGLVNMGAWTRAQANAALAAENDHDTVSYANSFSGVDVDFERSVQHGGDAEGDRISQVENFDGSGRDDFLRGDDKANVIYGDRGADVLEGRGGADRLEGSFGLDTAAYDSSSARVVVDLMAATQSGGDAQGDTLDSIENLRGSAFDDILRGDDSATGNRIFGGAGRDTIEGRGGNDVIDGGIGNDTIDGGTGRDFIDLQSWSDLHLSLGFTRTEVNLLEGSAVRQEFSFQSRSFLTTETDQLSRIEGVNGTVYNDTIIGNTLDNDLFGNDGNDTLSGDGGIDVLIGGGGDDRLNGGDGDDRLIGGTQTDIEALTGGAGRDTFVYQSRSDSNTTATSTGDVIVDFNTDEDLIDLRALHVNVANLRLDDSGVGAPGREGHLFEDLNGNGTFDATELNINIVLSGSAEFSLQDVLV